MLALLCLIQGIALFFDRGSSIGDKGQRDASKTNNKQTTSESDERDVTTKLVDLINAQVDQIRAYREETNWDEKKRGFRESVTIMLLALAFGATVTQAIIARRQLDSFDSEAHIRLRAYVSINHIALYNMRKGGDLPPLDAYLNITDKGQTVARKVDIAAGIAVHNLPEPRAFDALGELKKEFAPISLAANGNPAVIQRTTDPISNQQFDNVFAKTARIYVFGYLSYFDVFGDKHWLRFCNFYWGTELLPNDQRGTYPGYEAQACENPDFNAES